MACLETRNELPKTRVCKTVLLSIFCIFTLDEHFISDRKVIINAPLPSISVGAELKRMRLGEHTDYPKYILLFSNHFGD